MEFSLIIIALAVLALPIGVIWSVIKVRELSARVAILEKQLVAQGSPLVQERPDPWRKKEVQAPKLEEPALEAKSKRTIPQTPPKPKQKAKPPKESIESQLGSKWLVWVGGIALIFGGVFLVNYSIEHGLLGPWERIASGLILGALLLSVGEWLRRQPTESKYTSAWPHMPIAVTAAGITTMFGTVYAGYALYDLFAPIVAFSALAAVSMAAVIIAVLHGQLLGLLGVAGAYVVPMLISSDDPSAVMLYSYLFIFGTASLALFKYKGWANLGWANLAGSLGWALIGIAAFPTTQTSTIAIGLYLLASFALFVVYAWNKDEGEAPTTLLEQLIQTWSSPSQQVSLISAIGISCLMVFLVMETSHSVVSLMMVGCVGIGLLAVARVNVNLIGFAFLSLLVPLAVLLSWDFSNEILVKTPRYLGTDIRFGFNPEIIIPQGYELFQSIALATLLIHLVAGALFAITHKRVGFWAILSVLSPLSIFMTSYWKINGLQTLPVWSFIALALATVFTGLAHFMSKQKAIDIQKHGLASYVVGGFAALALAFGAGLESHWLAISIAVLLPAMGWVNKSIPLVAIRWFSYPLIIFILAQLLLEGHLWAFLSDGYKVVDWYLYGYGIPALALATTSYIFGKERKDHLVSLLEAGALSCWITTLSLLIHDFAYEALNQTGYSFAEQSMQSTVWLLNSLGIFWLNKRAPSVVRDYAWKILLGVSTLQVIFLQLLMSNPWLFTHSPVGEWPIINWLLVGYAVPAIFGMVFARIYKAKGNELYARQGAGLSFVLLFTYISMEIHRWFAGPVLKGAAIQEAELYTYSVVWLLFAALLMALAIRFKKPDLQKGALAVLVLTVLKVFIYDMAQLEGLLRAVSFLGLGGSLIGIGYVYQRFIAKSEPQAPAQAE